MSSTIDPNIHPEQLVSVLRDNARRRASFFLNHETGKLQTSDPMFEKVAAAMNENARDFALHEAVFLEVGTETGALLAAFLHRTSRGQPAGGVRHWPYATLTALLDDGLRLSRGMGRKNSLAGLWWGGGKGIIAQQKPADQQDALYRGQLYRDYGRFITQLRGAYVTAEDVGTTASDMANIFETTRFVTCVPASVGGSGNPSKSTARGVVAAMEAAMLFKQAPNLTEREFLQRMGVGATLDAAVLDGTVPERSVLRDRRVIMQGTGNVARFMIGYLLERGVKEIAAFEISPQACEIAKTEHPDPRLVVRHVEPGDTSVFDQPGDIFAPNALGGILNADSIPRLNTGVVCGAANNQLLDDKGDGELLQKRGIVFVPDFVANRMGIVQCANEQYGSLPDDPAVLRHFDASYENSVQCAPGHPLNRAKTQSITPTFAANQLADDLSEQEHPIWPGRTRQLLRSLRGDAWERG